MIFFPVQGVNRKRRHWGAGRRVSMAFMSSRSAASLLGAAVVVSLLSPLPLRAAGDVPESASQAPRWGIAARYGYYGVPDWLLDLLFEEHPSVDGTIVGGELRYYGDGGPSGVFSIGLTVDAGSSEGFGIWQEKSSDRPVAGGGEVDILAATVTAYWDLWPSGALHPYFGLGLGAAYAEGRYEQDGEKITVEEFVPALHIPAGLVLNLGEHLGLALEARVIDGFSWGGSLQLRF